MTTTDERQTLAGEYVLGTLSATERASVESQLSHDVALRQAVDEWEARLHPLTALAAPAEPSADLWERIRHSVNTVASTTAAAHPPAPTPATAWWNSLRLWRGLTSAGFATAALLAGVLITREIGPSQSGYVVVLVAPQNQTPGWVVQVNSQDRLNLVPLGTVTVPADKSLQLWTKADGWSGPLSLGLIVPGKPLQIPLDKLPKLQANQLFELTLEPQNGSPIGRPTGPIQFIGRAVKST